MKQRIKISNPREVKKSRTKAQSALPSKRAISTWMVPLVVFAVTLAVFYPALNGNFLNWDDQANLLSRPYYRGFGWRHLRWMFTTFYLGNYRPLTWMTFALDYTFWGLDPTGYHLTNLLLHGGNALLFYFIVRRLLGLAFSLDPVSEPLNLRLASGFAALVFAIHPLRVEPAAWLSARNHLLAALFCLGTVISYLRAAASANSEQEHRRWLATAVGLYALSLLSQPSGISVPFLLLVLDVYPLKRLGKGRNEGFAREVRRLCLEKIPFLVLASVGGIVAMLAKEDTGIGFQQMGALPWLAQGFYKLTFYVVKTIVPVDLLPLYLWPIHFSLFDWRVGLSAIAILGITGATLAARRRWPWALATWLAYLVLIAPYLFFMPIIEGAENSIQIAADRYSYLCCMPLAVLTGAGVLRWLRSRARSRVENSLAGSLALAALVGLVVLSWRQTQVWHNSQTLWTYALAAGDQSAVAYNNLGTALMEQHRIDEAIDQFKMTLTVNPRDAGAYLNIGLAWAQKNDREAAIQNYREAVRIKPDYFRAVYALAVTLAEKHDFADAAARLKEALEFKKSRSQSYFNLANVLIMQNRGAEAVGYLRLALRAQPDFAEADDQLGNLLGAQGNIAEAVQHLRRAVELDPEWSQAHFDLANALVRQGNLEAAVAEFQQALQRRPDYVEAHNNLGRVLAAQGDLSKAVEHFREALRLRPDYSPARESLAMALAEQTAPH